ncbi:unnamed protein product [Leuciscus chuanchicus]
MAPGCLLACRRMSMPLVLYVLLWAICWSVIETTAALTYDRQALLYLRLSSADCCGRIPIEDYFFNSRASSIFPAISCHSTGCCLHRKKRARKRGKRSGLLVRLKRRGAPSLHRLSDSWTPFRQSLRQRRVNRGVDIRNLRTLEYVKPPAVLTDIGPQQLLFSFARCMWTTIVCGFAEESSCTPGFQSELLVFKVHRDELHQGKRLGRVIFNACDGRTRTLFQSSDKGFDVDTDGTVTLKRQVTLHEGHKVFSVDAWDSSGKKHTVSVRVERVHHHHEDHHMDTVMNISSPQMESPADDLVLMFPKSSTGLKRTKRDLVIPPFFILEDGKGPFPQKLVQLIAHATGVDGNFVEAPMEIIVNVLNQNDNKPVFTQNQFNGSVPEAADIGHEFMTVTATDADDQETTDNGVISYSIVKQDPELPKPNLFTINPVTGGIQVNASGLDKEKWPTYTLLITATDRAGEGFSSTGTAVITVTGKSEKIMYKVGSDPAGWLSVDQDTVMIKVKRPTDRESPFVKDGKYTAIILTVVDGNPPATGTGTLVIDLEDLGIHSVCKDSSVDPSPSPDVKK